MLSPWCLYMIECGGGGTYIGIAVDVDSRYGKHVAGNGAIYPPLPARSAARQAGIP